jgi:hypothetical protein
MLEVGPGLPAKLQNVERLIDQEARRCEPPQQQPIGLPLQRIRLQGDRKLGGRHLPGPTVGGVAGRLEIQAETGRGGTARIEPMVLIRQREEVRGLADTLGRAE